MSEREAFEHTMASLYDAMLDDTRWPAASARIDEACGLTGNSLILGDGPKDDVRVSFVGVYQRGQRRSDIEREYLADYHPADERVPRVRQLPDSRLVHVTDVYSAGELKTSPTYNEILRRARHQDSLAVRLEVSDDCYIAWGLGDPVGRRGWEDSQITMIKRLQPCIRQFVRVRQALVRARALETTAAALLDNPRIGVIHLDRHGRVLAANDRAFHILRQNDGLSDRDGILRALAPADQPRFQQLLAAALPNDATVAVSGSMPIRRAAGLPPLVAHVKPAGVTQPDYGERPIAALVLLVEPGHRRRINPDLVAETLGLTPGESQVAVWLAEGRSVEEMARDTGNTRNSVYWHLKQMYQKLHISRQADLVRLVLSVAELE